MIPPKTPRFNLPYLDPSQAQPEVKINESLNIIDAALGEFSSDTSSDSGGPGAITVEDIADSPSVTVAGVTRLRFEGATVEDTGGGVATVVIPSGEASSLDITDGVNTVTGVTSLTVSGATVGGTTPNATLSIAGGGGGGLPTPPGGVSGSIMCWFRSDLENAGVGQNLPRLNNYGMPGYNPLARLTGAVGAASTLNSKPWLLMGGTINTSLYLFDISTGGGAAMLLGTVGCTIFFVGDVSTLGTINGIIGSTASSGIEFDVQASTGELILVSSGVAILGTSTGTVAANTPFQANVSYDGATGNIEFRISQASAGSASGVSHPITGPSSLIGAETLTLNPFNGHWGELIVFARPLTLPEKMAVEAELFSRWAV